MPGGSKASTVRWPRCWRAAALDAVHILTPPDTHADRRARGDRGRRATCSSKSRSTSSRKRPPRCANWHEQRGLALGVGHNFLFAEPYVRLREDVRAGRLGRLDSVAVTWNRELSFVTQGPYDVWMLRDPANIMLEVGVHSVAHVWDLLGLCDEWHVDAANPKVLPTGITFFRRWHARTRGRRHGGRTELLVYSRRHRAHDPRPRSLRHGDGRSRAQHVHARPPHALFDGVRPFRAGPAAGRSALPRRPERTSAGTCLSKLKLSRYGNAYGASIAASVAEFYRLVRDGRADGRIAPRFAAEVVAAAETIGRLGVRALRRNESWHRLRPRRPAPRAGRACSFWEEAALSGASWWHSCSRAGHDVRVLARKPSLPLLDRSPSAARDRARRSAAVRRSATGARRNRTRVPSRPPGGQDLEGVPGAGCRSDAADRHALSRSRNQAADLHGDDRLALPGPRMRERSPTQTLVDSAIESTELLRPRQGGRRSAC